MPVHPLDPLSAAEIRAAASCIKSYAPAQGITTDTLRFNTITLLEPPKKDLVAYDANPETTPPPPRQAFCIIQQTGPDPKAFEAIVLLSETPVKVTCWQEIDAQPLASPDDCFLAEEIVKANVEVQSLLKEKYGITDMSMVVCDPWSVHLPPVPGRLIQTFMYTHMKSSEDNAYAHPLDFVPIVDLNKKQVVKIDKPYGDTPPEIPSEPVNYHKDLCEKPPRTDLKPLNIVQPQGPSWEIQGNLIKWQKWHIRISFNYREGLVLHNVAYDDAGKVRPVMHRASLVEMAVPYADPRPPFTRKCAFDVGDYGLGNCANSLELGCDCLGKIHYFDAVLNNSAGEPYTIKKAICMHEEDAGILFKHMEYRTGHAEVRRSRRLVLSFIATVVNYEYAFYWSFYQDGTIGYEIKLTGELSTNLVSPGEDPSAPEYGTLVAKGVNAQYHQHMFSARIDMAVDDAAGGAGLVVTESEVEQLPEGPNDPTGNGFILKETELLYEQDAARVAEPLKGRYWKIKNPQSLHPITGKPVAWKIMAQPCPLLLAKPGSGIHSRGGFATKHLWVTPHSDEERWPAGDYTIQDAATSKGGLGLPEWTKKNRFCGAGADPVVWLTLGATHIPRVEDFPVMPCEVVGFMLKPVNFFDGNPGVDLPAGGNAASELAGVVKCCAANGVSVENGGM